MRLVLILSLLWNTAFAECSKNVEFFKEGQPLTAKCDGFYVKKDLMNELKNNDEVLKLKEKEIQNLKDISLRQEQMTQFYKDRTVTLGKELDKSESRSFWKGVGMFALGVLVTGAASYAAIQATK